MISFRIATTQWMTDNQLKKLLNLFDKYRDIADELAFFIQETHSPLPLDIIGQRLERLNKVLPLIRERGMRAGINVLTTIGHHEENLANSLPPLWQNVVDPYGNKCLGSFCPEDPQHREYVKRLYTMIAEINPDFIWIDDDVRLFGHKPVKAVCFCDKCVKEFSNEIGKDYTREELVKELESDNEYNFELRHKWLEHNRKLIDSLLKLIEEAVHKVNPKIILGFMTGDRFYEGYAFDRWANTLSRSGEFEIKWRTGGGFYSDEKLLELVEKSQEIGRQVSKIPTYVEDIQAEIENFPYHILKKGARTTVVEAGAHMAAGATGAAFNILSQHDDPLDEYEIFLDEIKKGKPFYDLITKQIGRSACEGVWPVWNEDLFVINGYKGKWLDSSDYIWSLKRPYTLAEIGIPISYSVEKNTVIAFSGRTPLCFSYDKLKEIFKKGVIMDVPALINVEKMGLSYLCGVEVDKSYSKDVWEKLTDNSLNGKFAGWKRDCRQSFWEEDGYTLKLISDNVQILSELFDYGGNNLGPCMTAYENEIGGRVIVMGYFPWSYIHNAAKVGQLKSICQWVSYDRLPVIVDNLAKVITWVRIDRLGNKVFILLNASLDRISELNLRVISNANRFILMTLGGDKKEVESESMIGSQYKKICLTGIELWSMYILMPKL